MITANQKKLIVEEVISIKKELARRHISLTDKRARKFVDRLISLKQVYGK